MPFPVAAAVAVAPTVISTISSLFSGGGGSNIEDMIKMLRKQTIQTSGAAGKLDEAILGQNLAGSSRLQKQNVLGRQQNRQLEALFNQLSEDDQRALSLLLRSQGQQDRLRFARNQSLFANISQIAQNLPDLLGKKTTTTSGTQNKSIGNNSLFGLQDDQDILNLILGSITNPSTRGKV